MAVETVHCTTGAPNNAPVLRVLGWTVSETCSCAAHRLISWVALMLEPLPTTQGQLAFLRASVLVLTFPIFPLLTHLLCVEGFCFLSF